MNFETRLEQYRASCEQALVDYGKPLLQPHSVVSEAAAYGLFSGGKRVRGVLVLAVNRLLGGEEAMALPLAAAIEMMHAFSLIHDDLPCMDNDEMRRGKPSVHMVYGEANALLAGDLLAIQAFEAATAPTLPAKVAARAANLLAAAAGARGMIYGQELDKHYETTAADENALYTIHRHKTGALISAAASLGICSAVNAENEQIEIQLYAKNVGIVFQIVDDILDVVSTSETLGKPVGSDSRQGKTTFASLHGVEASRLETQCLTQEAVKTLQNRYGKDADFLSEFAMQLASRVF